MNMYLVSGDITLHVYRDEAVPKGRETRLVKAETAKEAEAKFEAYWESKASPYSYSYYTSNVVVHETIE
jgi:hypothetical protein